MNIKKQIITTVIILISTLVIAQHKTNTNLEKANYYLSKKGEVCFSFSINNINELENITSIISIDKYNKQSNKVIAYANKKEFAEFLKLNKAYLVSKTDNEHDYQKMFDISSNKSTNVWDSYPTYTTYLQMMSDFQTNYPNLCKLVNIDTSENGRDLLVVKLSDNVSTHEQEPRFLYVGTMHGDETAGYIILLRLIDYFLTNYGTDPEVTNMLDNTEIWISPLSNPDGTYAGGNNSVSGATRYNANNKDLNRNFPDPDNGMFPTGAWQAETKAYMNFVDTMHFVMSANTHGGSEVVNYPFDTYYTLNADDNWWQLISRDYADTVQFVGPTGFFNDLNNGITNGAAWYSIAGGRQDYMNYYHQCREVTLELSAVKLVAAANLPAQWNYHHRALINYIKEIQYGVSGVITDSISGQPLEASVYISGHDYLRSNISSELPYGDYYRPTYAGTYDITFSADCYQTKTITNVSITNYAATTLNVQLVPLSHDTVTVSNQTICAIGPATFNAVASGTVIWYDSLNSTNSIFIGDTFSTPILSTTTDYWVENLISDTGTNIGSTDYLLNGAYRTDDFYTIFDCFKPIKLTQLTVNANASGTIIIQLQDSVGVTLQTDTVFVPQYGVNVLDVNFDIPVGKDLRLYRDSASMGLHRNNASVAYPYEHSNILSIKRSSASSSKSYYYYFYDWKLQKYDCVSDRIKTTAFVNDTAVADFSFVQYSSTVDFTNLSTAASSYLWDFGDGNTSTDINPTHIYGNNGYYNIQLIAYNNCGNDTIIDALDVFVNINENEINNINIYPNPANTFVIVESNKFKVKSYSIVDITGKMVKQSAIKQTNNLTIDISDLDNGIYFLNIKTSEFNINKRLIKQ